MQVEIRELVESAQLGRDGARQPQVVECQSLHPLGIAAQRQADPAGYRGIDVPGRERRVLRIQRAADRQQQIAVPDQANVAPLRVG